MGFGFGIRMQAPPPALWTIEKTSGNGAVFDAGASTTTTIAGDGYVEFIVDAGTNKERVLGFSDVDNNFGWQDVDYGFYLTDGGFLYISESSGLLMYMGVSPSPGDILRITRTGTTVTYNRNGATIYTSLVSSSGAIRLDSALYSSNGKLTLIKLVDGTKQVPLSWQNTTNVTLTST